jgi:phosphoadenosine phosphosulfate reductase
MQALEAQVEPRPIDTALLSQLYASATAEERLTVAIERLFPGRIALVSSFGADAVVLLHLLSRVNRSVPVIFVDTGHIFPETLAYRDQLIERFRLADVRTVAPDPDDLAAEDPESFLWANEQDRCCRVRKVVPLARALGGFDAWISGRKRFQAATREALAIFEQEGERTKVNPLADWSAADMLAYMTAHDLPRHELVAKRYLSIGCIPCTSAVRPGEDARAGRWRGKAKVECGIHTEYLHAGDGI